MPHKNVLKTKVDFVVVVRFGI